MAEIKYTTDGKKVVVIGDLNQTDKIVQEIFVTEDGKEIPSGERFVVKSLLDQPAKTWKQKELEELDRRYDKEKKEWEAKIDRLTSEKQLAYSALSARVKWLRNVAKEPHQQELKDAISRIADFLSNNNKWVVVNDYSRYRLEPFNDEGINRLDIIEPYGYNSKRYDSMRLLSLYGNSDGSLSYRIDSFSDGSGSGKNDVMFFSDKDSALSFLQNKLDEINEYNSSTIEMAREYGLMLDKEKLDAYHNKRRLSILKDIERLNEDMEKYKNQLDEIMNNDMAE